MLVEIWLNTKLLHSLDFINQVIFLIILLLSELLVDHGVKSTSESVVVESILDLADGAEEAQAFASHFTTKVTMLMTLSTILNYAKSFQAELNEKYQTEHNKLLLPLSMAPQFFGTIIKHLKSEQIVDGKGFERLIVEKPFGTDYETATN